MHPIALAALLLQPPPAEMVQSEVITKSATYKPGVPVTVALKLTLDEAWHVYWRNPGDSGVGTEVKWTLPKGWKAGPLRFPTPERINLGIGYGYSFGYENEVVFLAHLTPPANASGPAKIAADMSLLACKTDCVPADQSFSFTLQPGNGLPVAQAQFEAWGKKMPVQVPVKQIKATLKDRKYFLTIPGNPKLAGAISLDFFPGVAGQATTDKPSHVTKNRDGSWSLVVPAGQAINAMPKEVPFLVIPLDKEGHHLNQGVEFVPSS